MQTTMRSLRACAFWYVGAILAAHCGGSVTDLSGPAGSAGNAAGVAGAGGTTATVAGAGGSTATTGAGVGGAAATVPPVPTAAPTVPPAATSGTPGPCAFPGLESASILFDSNRNNLQWDIFQMRADGAGVTTLVGGPSDDKEPALAPDNNRLAYSSNRSGTYQIIIRDLASGFDTPLTSMPNGARQPSWSSDGELITFTSDGPSQMDEGGNVYVVEARQGAVPRLVLAANDSYFSGFPWRFPSFTPGNSSIIASTSVSLVEAFLDGRATRDIVPITSRIPEPDEASVSPDGQRIVFEDYCGLKASELYIVRLDGSTGDTCANGIELTDLPFHPRHPAWGSAKFIAFDGGDGTSDIYVLSLGDGSAAPVVCNLTRAHSVNRNPVWAPPR